MYAPVMQKYLDDLAAKQAAPGGGSACALAAALAQSLVSMVINFTLGKPRYAAFQQDLVKWLDRSEALRAEFLRLVDLDVAAFNSKDIRQALDVPLMIARLCREAIAVCPELISKGNVNLVSDVAVAAVLFEAAFTGARCNVDINLKMLKDPQLSSQIDRELSEQQEAVRSIRLDTEVRVGKIIRG